MLIAKKCLFGKSVNASTYSIDGTPIEGKIYIPVLGYTKAEVDAMWAEVTNIIEMPNFFISIGAIGAGWPCYDPGYSNVPLSEMIAYSVYADKNYNPDCVLSNLNTYLGTASQSQNNICYLNSLNDGFFLKGGSNPIFRVNGSNVFNWGQVGYMFGISNTSNNTTGAIAAFFVITSDGYWGLFRVSTVSKSSSYLRWATEAQSESLTAWLETLESLPEDEDPFTPGGVSEPETDPGEFERDGEDVDIPALPTLSAVQSNFITVYNPTLAQLQNLSTYLWSSDIADVLKKLFSDPMSAILGLSIVPVTVPNAGAREVYIGNVATGVNMNIATSQYVEIDCGTAILPLYFGAYLDYSPYTKIEVYLPYIGVRALDADEIVGKTMSIKYHVDILSGACCAYIKVNGTVLYTFIGQCSATIPITGRDFASVVNGVLNIAGAIGSTVATGGATAPAAVSSIVSTAFNGSMKPQIEKSGAVSGVGGFFGVQKPYLIVTTPRQCLPAKQNKFVGYPSFVTLSLGNISGYTEVEKVHLENIPCTDDELNEIETLLKEGVIF